MATPISLLQLSPTMSEGTIVRWLVKEGDAIKAGKAIAEVETDKAVMEMEAFDEGTILKLLVKEGDVVKVGGQVAIVGKPGEDASSAAAPAPAAAKKAEPAKEEPKKEAKTPGGAPMPVVNLMPKGESGDAATASLAAAAKGAENGGRVVASPLARKIAADAGIDLAAVAGTGPHNRIIKRDVEAALAAPKSSAKSASPAATPYVAGAGDVDVPVSGMRKVIARRLQQSRQEAPSFSLSVDVAAEPLLAAAAKMKALYPDAKVTVTHFLIKAMAATIMKHEWLRTQWVDGKMVRKNAAHISVAVAIEDGLLTPVIRNAESKGVVALAAELRDLAGKARDRKLTEADLSGGVQTISNLGMFGIEHFDAIINIPESSILAVGAVVDKPVVRGGAVVPGKVMTLTLSCDHRVVDGAVGAAYLKDLKAVLEEPLLMLA